MTQEKSITYQTNRKNYQSEYVRAWLLLPVFGYGFLKLHKLNKKVKAGTYRIFNDRIEAGEGEATKTIYINKLEKVERIQSEEQRKYKLSDLILYTETEQLKLVGIRQAEQIEDVLYVAIEKKKQRKALQKKAKGDYTEYKIGGLEQMNNLVGMWQQGLISNEDFEREQKKYKKESPSS